jgi:hypothetical protein
LKRECGVGVIINVSILNKDVLKKATTPIILCSFPRHRHLLKRRKGQGSACAVKVKNPAGFSTGFPADFLALLC